MPKLSIHELSQACPSQCRAWAYRSRLQTFKLRWYQRFEVPDSMAQADWHHRISSGKLCVVQWYLRRWFVIWATHSVRNNLGSSMLSTLRRFQMLCTPLLLRDNTASCLFLYTSGWEVALRWLADIFDEHAEDSFRNYCRLHSKRSLRACTME